MNVDSTYQYDIERNIEDGYDRIKRFLNCKDWICECGLNNFGRNKYCANYKCKKDRPTDYVESKL